MTVTPRSPRRFLLPFAVVGLILVGIIVLSVSVLTAPTPSRAPSATASQIAATARPTPTVTPVPTPAATPTATAAPVPSSPPTIVTARFDDTDPGGVYEVHYQYPQIETGTSPFAGQINAEIKSQVETTAKAFAAGPAAIPRADGRPNTLQGTYSEALVRPGLFSFRLKEQEDFGGAHPATNVLTATYDLSVGQRIGLGDVFSDLPAGLAILSDQSKQALRQQLGDAYDQTVVNDGTNPSAQNFAAWTLTEQGIEITFQEYQVAPSAFGAPVVVVKWADLRQVLDASSPAKDLWAGS